MTYRLRLEIPGLPPMNTSATRRHWAVQAREARDTQTLVAALVGKRRPPKPLKRARVTVTRCSPREPDFENMTLSSKAHIDGLVKARVLVDDNPDVCERVYRWAKAPRGQGRLVIDVEEIE